LAFGLKILLTVYLRPQMHQICKFGENPPSHLWNIAFYRTDERKNAVTDGRTMRKHNAFTSCGLRGNKTKSGSLHESKVVSSRRLLRLLGLLSGEKLTTPVLSVSLAMGHRLDWFLGINYTDMALHTIMNLISKRVI